MSNKPSPDASPNVVELRGLTKQYRSNTAVNELDLAVPVGTTLGLLGPNGAGKSTTMKMLMGMLKPSRGTVQVLGETMSLTSAHLKQEIGYVPESHHIYRWMTVREVTRFAKSFYSSWNDDACDELLDRFKLLPQKKVKQLSKGMLAKLSLVVALAHQPKLLVLDEPLSGLDPIVRDEFIDGVLADICREDRSVIFSSHQLQEVSRLADRVAIMNEGGLLVDCAIDTLIENTRRVEAVLHDGKLPGDRPPNTVWQKLDRRQWQLTIHPFDNVVERALEENDAVKTVQTRGLGLDEIFRDFIKGQGQAC